MSSSVAYVGLTRDTRAVAGQLLLVSFRRVVKAWDVTREILSVGTADTGRDPLPVTAKRFYENLAGSQVAWCVEVPSIDEGQNVAVALVKLSSRLPTSTVGEVVGVIEPYFPGTEVFRVSAVGAGASSDQREQQVEKEVGKAVEEDAAQDRAESSDNPLRQLGVELKKLVVFLVAGLLVIGVVYAYRKGGS